MKTTDKSSELAGLAMTTTAVAGEYVAMCRKGKFNEAIDRFFSTDHVRVEAVDLAGSAVEIRGLQAVKENMTRFTDDSEVHGAEIGDPLIAMDKFAVRFDIDTTFRSIGERSTVTKISLYSVEGGKIVREEVFYLEPPPPTVRLMEQAGRACSTQPIGQEELKRNWGQTSKARVIA